MKTPIYSHKKIQATALFLCLSMACILFPQVSQANQIVVPSTFAFELVPGAALEKGLTMDEVAKNDQLVLAVQQYLAAKGSPLAPYADQIIRLPQWQHALGITFVESNYCLKAKNFNCGSVGVAPGHKQWRKFQTPFDGFKAVSDLLERPLYKDRYNTCKKKLRVYVVPGSQNWLRGCEKVEKEMHELTQKAVLAQIQQHTTTHKDLAMAK